MNPILYTLAQKSPGTYFNDVTTGNNDYNTANDARFDREQRVRHGDGIGDAHHLGPRDGPHGHPAGSCGLGLPRYGGTPTFTATPNFAGSNSTPFGVSLNTVGLSCSEVGTFTSISPTLPVASYTLLGSSCSGASLTGANASDYAIVYTSATNDFTVLPAPVNVAVSGSQTYGGMPTFSGSSTPPTGITVTTSSLSCTELQPLPRHHPGARSRQRHLAPGVMCRRDLERHQRGGLRRCLHEHRWGLHGHTAPLAVTASSASMTYGGSSRPSRPGYSGFVNGDTASSLTTTPTCSTTATSASPVPARPTRPRAAAPSTATTRSATPWRSHGESTRRSTVTASSGSMAYGGTPPMITAVGTGFVNGDTASSLTHAAHLLEHRHQLQPGRGLALCLVLVQGRPTPTTRSSLRRRIGRA